MTKPIHVLHVDDEPNFAELAAEFLEREDDRLAVEPARSASEGLDRLASGDFDCIVSDYEMPGRNGIEFLEAVREEYPDVPFILYTGKGSEAVASDAISAGVTDYLQKETGTEQYELLTNRVRNAVERARAQRARQRHLNAIESAREGISILNEDGEFIYVNEAYAELYGYDSAEMIGEHWGLLYRDEDVQRISDEILPTVEANGFWHGETTGLRADGSTFVEDHALATTETGELVCTVQDITERKDRERVLKQKERRYQAIFNDPNILVGLLDTDGTVLDINETAMEYIDAELADVTGEPFCETPWFTGDETIQGEVRQLVEQAATGEYVEFEVDLSETVDDPLIVSGVIRPVTNDDDEVVSLLISDRDITERKQRERELENQRDELRIYERAVESSSDLLAAVDTEYNFLFANERYRDFHGITSADITDLSAPAVIGESWEADAKQRFDRALEGDAVQYEMERTGPNGDIHTFDIRYHPLTDENGILGVVGAMRDITERKEREQELELKTRAMDEAPVGILITDPAQDDNPIIYANDRFQQLTGYAEDDILGRNCRFLQGEDTDPELVAEMREAIDNHEPVTVELRNYREDGSEFWNRVSIAPVENDDGDVTHFVGFQQDITEWRQ